MLRLGTLVVLAALCSTPLFAQESVDEKAVEIIRKHGLDNSQVMETLSLMTDVYGPRLTGSPGLDRASDWAIEELEALGLENVHRDEWGPFGKGWTLNRFSMNATSPVSFPIIAHPKAWSPGTDGRVEAELVVVDVENLEALTPGSLTGKIVMMETPRDLEEDFTGEAQRRDTENLLGLANYVGGDQRSFRSNPERMRQIRQQQQAMRAVVEQQPLAIVNRYFKGEYGTLFVSSASVVAPADASVDFFNRPRAWNPGDVEVIPQVTLAVEHYNRLYRLAERGHTVTVELEMDVTFDESDPMEYNVIGDFPGTDDEIGDEIVMVGAHFDSWHAGTGTTDNGAGSSVMMEVMRILKETYNELGRSPRRTIRIALWTGEEQGLLGSRAHVEKFYASGAGFNQPPEELKPLHDKFAGYFNMDNGTGKIRGVYMQGNEGVAPIFRSWLKPFHDLEASTLSLSNTGGTDHLAFDAVGLPGFQFIQDPIAYSPRTHHSNMDVLDHAIEDDLKQAATIIATFAYHTAERDEKLPRKPLQLRPEVTSPSGGF